MREVTKQEYENYILILIGASVVTNKNVCNMDITTHTVLNELKARKSFLLLEKVYKYEIKTN